MSVWTDMQKRSSGEDIRQEDSFIYENRSVEDLDVDTNKRLCDVDNFTGFSPFICKDIHDNVRVVLIDRETRNVTVTLDELKKELKELEQELEILKKAGADQEKLGEIQEKTRELKGIIDSCIKARKTEHTFEIVLLGKYVRENGKPTIYLMWGTLKRDPNYTNLTAIVYVHELMHAFFDMPDNECGMDYIPHPHFSEIEEPLAEFGMLSFMEMFERQYPGLKILDYAKAHVRRKKYSLGTCHYGFGYYLFEDRRNFCVDWVNIFHLSCLFIDKSGNYEMAYKSMLSPIHYPVHEYSCETTLYKILHPRRFHFIKDVAGSSRKATKSSCPSGTIDRIDLAIGEEVSNNKEFKKDYLYLLPLGVVITFVGQSGCRIKGDAKIYRNKPMGARIYIESDKNLLAQYAVFFKGKVHFLLYEDKPEDGSGPAEWIAKEIKV